jgi:hypothetical protein
VSSPDGQHVGGVAAADVDEVLLLDEGAEVGDRAAEEGEVRRLGTRGREGAVEGLDVPLRVAAGGRKEADARARAAGQGEGEVVEQRVVGLVGEAAASEGDDLTRARRRTDSVVLSRDRTSASEAATSRSRQTGDRSILTSGRPRRPEVGAIVADRSSSG